MRDPRDTATASNPAATTAERGSSPPSADAALSAAVAHAINNALAALLTHLDLAVEALPAAVRDTDAARRLEHARIAARRVRELVEPVPVAPPVSAAPRPATAPPSSGRPMERRPRVVVVDDDPSLGRAVERVLTQCEVVAFDDPSAALARIVSPEDVDLVLCDLMMPGMTGMDLYDAVVKAAPARAQKMVFLTGGALTTRAREFIATVPRTVLSKPLDAEELRAVVREREGLLGATGGSVLVVDDDDAARKLIARWLASAKLACLERPTGTSALEVVQAAPDRIDAIILDVMMPGLNGFDVIRRLKAEPATAGIPILMLSAHATGEADVTQGMEAGATDYLAKPFSGPVLVAKVRAAVERRRDERELRSRLQTAEEDATTDALTGLSNRRAFDAQLPVAIERSRRNGEALTLALLDLDHFKKVNDTYGHPGGDQLLAYFAQAVRQVVRQGDMAFRYGGEEFAVLLPRCDADAAVRVLTRIQRVLRERPVSLEGHPPIVARFSAGVAAAEAGNAFRTEGLVGRADAALYEAKRAGRDRIEVEH